ncbi:hypothetical protein HGM15179_004506 [Zosterops borbonicus]|uniref:Uncharacterized protein n=1 Tax=Zosterops borbonicus TaxID=364589 RepID=A0A8K1GRN4_9PASS|nr:hypothetical protein HGM15179_004506 [Zosterops borbonicus]
MRQTSRVLGVPLCLYQWKEVQLSVIVEQAGPQATSSRQLRLSWVRREKMDITSRHSAKISIASKPPSTSPKKRCLVKLQETTLQAEDSPGSLPNVTEPAALGSRTVDAGCKSLKDIFFDSTVGGQGILLYVEQDGFAETVVLMIKFKQ